MDQLIRHGLHSILCVLCQGYTRYHPAQDGQKRQFEDWWCTHGSGGRREVLLASRRRVRQGTSTWIRRSSQDQTQRDSPAESTGIECKKQEQRCTHKVADKSTGSAYLHCDGHDMVYALRAKNDSSSRCMSTRFQRGLSFGED